MPPPQRCPGECPSWGTIVVLDAGRAPVATWPLRGRGHPSIDSVDELARLELVARRLGGAVRVRDACSHLADLIELAGLTGVLIDSGDQRKI